MTPKTQTETPLPPRERILAAAGELSLVAALQKPGGMRRTMSPWLIHTENSLGSPLNSAAGGSEMRTTAGPYSRLVPG